MKEITKRMTKDFEITKKGYDFMGYKVYKNTELNFHHLVVARRNSDKLPKQGFIYENGSILARDNHSYLHLIECYDYDRFMAITSEMLDMKFKGYLDIENLKYIKDILLSFEEEYKDKKSKKGRILIRDEYIRNRFGYE